MEKKTIIDLFESSVKRFPGNPFLWEKTGKRFEPTTYSEVRDLVSPLNLLDRNGQ